MSNKISYIPIELKDGIKNILTENRGKIFLVFFIFVAIWMSLYFFNRNDDLWEEEYLEQIIQAKIGIPFDLTPGSEE